MGGGVSGGQEAAKEPARWRPGAGPEGAVQSQTDADSTLRDARRLPHSAEQRFDLTQIIDKIDMKVRNLPYNPPYVEIQVAVVQYQSVIPHLVETVIRRCSRLNQDMQVLLIQ